ncbi:MAG: hypothetical protein AAB704_00200 [Patescibacteria group bacterium]
MNETWTPKLAYAIGLLASDGCLLSRGHQIDLTSKDREQLENFIKCLGLSAKIGKKKSGLGMSYLRVQFRSVLFYNFLTSIGLTPAKSKTIGVLKIPKKFFFDFLRGSFDGDGTIYSYWDPRWKSSFMFYLVFISASRKHIDWLRAEIASTLGVRGHLNKDGRKIITQLKYAKKESLKILAKMYPSKEVICLSRKRLKIELILDIVGEKLP